MTQFQVQPFQSPMSTAELKALAADATMPGVQARAVQVDRADGYPCRVTLEDAQPGETVWLIQYCHHRSESPYRASGPVFIRADRAATTLPCNQLPEFLEHRLLSVRFHDDQGMLRAADVLAGNTLARTLRDWPDDHPGRTVNVHNAAYGCFLCAIELR